MNDKKNTFLRVNVDTKKEKVIKKICEVKGLSIQSLLDNLLDDFILKNLDCIIKDNGK